MPVQLVAKSGFSAFGKDYPVGTVVPQADTDKWPPNTLATRMNNGYVSYQDVPEGAVGVIGEMTDYEEIQRADMLKDADDEKSDIGKMNEADLKAYVEMNGLTVDLDKLNGMGAKRKAVADAMVAKQAAIGRGGVAGSEVKPAAPSAAPAVK